MTSETETPSNAPSTFAELDLSSEMMQALERAGYHNPSPIQAGVIPVALDEVDVVGQAQTGTGKTAAFAIPILELLDTNPRDRTPQALILVPTRELAVQVSDEVEKLSYGLKVNSVSVYGGMPIKRQISRLQSGADIVVGTPGRVIDLIGRGVLDLQNVDCVVLDEADRMLDIGFRPDIERILRKCPKERQTLLLSATMPPPIRLMAEKYMKSPTFLDFSPKDIAVETIEQFFYTVEPQRKYELLVALIDQEEPRQVIVFCRTRRGVERLYQRLAKKFEDVGCMHGEMSQRERNRVMAAFRQEQLRFVIATDVMGRGIDVTTVSHIVNFDIPEDCDDYVHRVGRTGRMGREGVAYTFAAPDQGPELTRIEVRIDRLLKPLEMAGITHDPNADPADPAEPQEKREIPASLNRGRGKKRYRRW
ncbi:DEAD/DEAH box helicase [Planctomycetota bacterium]